MSYVQRVKMRFRKMGHVDISRVVLVITSLSEQTILPSFCLSSLYFLFRLTLSFLFSSLISFLPSLAYLFPISRFSSFPSYSSFVSVHMSTVELNIFTSVRKAHLQIPGGTVRNTLK